MLDRPGGAGWRDADWQPKPSVRAENSAPLSNELFLILFVLVVVFVVWSLIRGGGGTSSGRYARRGGGMIFLPTGGSDWGGGFGGGGGGIRWRLFWRRRLVGWRCTGRGWSRALPSICPNAFGLNCLIGMF